MKTRGRRESTNIVDLRRPAKKGDRLRPTPKRELPVELEDTKAMNGKLSIESYKSARRLQKTIETLRRINERNRKKR